VTLRIGSLCSGFGGLDMSVMDVLDAEVAWHAQYDPDDKHQYAAQILAHHWPAVPNHGDITAIDWTEVEPVDILTAGFPCQPVSNAGKRKGHEDDRWLWPDVASAIRVLRPRLVLLENVAALVGRGLDRVLAGLAEIGFDAEWACLRASEVGGGTPPGADLHPRLACCRLPGRRTRMGLASTDRGDRI
jgi:DNA (cytosine-5)-methyltransferase 1